MRKILSGLLVVLLLVLCQTAVFASTGDDTDQQLWRIDTKNISQMPRNFRTTNDQITIKPKDGAIPSTIGFTELQESGSAQFSKLEFAQMLTKLKGLSSGPIYIVDLRQESHGLVNGIGASWYGEHNWANVGKTPDQIVKDEKTRIKATLKAPVVLSVLDDDKNASESYKLAVDTAVTEEEFVKAQGLNYCRITVTDHSPPTDDNVDSFIKFYKELPKNAWLHFHCQAGEGRTSIFMVMYDILRNGKQVSLEDIVKRQIGIGGQNIMKTKAGKEKDAWKEDLFVKKVKFIKAFYEYVTKSPDDLPVAWSEWVRQNNK